MSARGQFNTKSPTIKRILKEATELTSKPSRDYHAEPLEDNLFEWHFTLRGPPAPSPYHTGLYHGRIILPPTYPLRPPSFRFLTPSGRFEVNREICLSISGHHEETWQPAWGIRTAMVAIRSFMDSAAHGQVGGLEMADESRRRLAEESARWRCARCGRSNGDIMRERERAAADEGEGEDAVPKELRLAYREDLGEKAEVKDRPMERDASSADAAITQDATTGSVADRRPSASSTGPDPPRAAPSPSRQRAVPPPTQAARPAAPRQPPPLAVSHNEGVPVWVDKAIYGIVILLILMVLRRIMSTS